MIRPPEPTIYADIAADLARVWSRDADQLNSGSEVDFALALALRRCAKELMRLVEIAQIKP